MKIVVLFMLIGGLYSLEFDFRNWVKNPETKLFQEYSLTRTFSDMKIEGVVRTGIDGDGFTTGESIYFYLNNQQIGTLSAHCRGAKGEIVKYGAFAIAPFFDVKFGNDTYINDALTAGDKYMEVSYPIPGKPKSWYLFKIPIHGSGLIDLENVTGGLNTLE